MRIGFLIGGLLVAVAVIALLRLGMPFGLDESEEAVELPAPAPIVEVPVAPRTTEPPPFEPAVEVLREDVEPPVVLPPLNESDDFIQEALAQFAVPPAWLNRDDLLRRFAVVVDNAARGEYPHRQLGFLAPAGKFRIVENSKGIFANPQNFQRYDAYLDVLEGIDPGTLANLLHQFEPLLSEALAEIGNRKDGERQLLAAIDQILAVPYVPASVELVQPKVFYEYADPKLEGLSPLQKQVLRFGPANVERLKQYLRLLASELRAIDP